MMLDVRTEPQAFMGVKGIESNLGRSRTVRLEIEKTSIFEPLATIIREK
jgi:hypothetical protein